MLDLGQLVIWIQRNSILHIKCITIPARKKVLCLFAVCIVIVITPDGGADKHSVAPRDSIIR